MPGILILVKKPIPHIGLKKLHVEHRHDQFFQMTAIPLLPFELFDYIIMSFLSDAVKNRKTVILLNQYYRDQARKERYKDLSSIIFKRDSFVDFIKWNKVNDLPFEVVNYIKSVLLKDDALFIVTLFAQSQNKELVLDQLLLAV